MKEPGRSVEFVANLPWFRDLFTEDELDEARSRLILHEFPVDERRPRPTSRTGPPICNLRRYAFARGPWAWRSPLVTASVS
jgi:hypothetical protein